MDLTEHQQWIVGEWALRTPHILEVRLVGSRARGKAKPESDIDLAITVDGDSPGTVLGNYFALGERWQEQLTELLEARVHVTLYNDPGSSVAKVLGIACSIAPGILTGPVVGSRLVWRHILLSQFFDRLLVF
jgi:predicted nucleotidyltransferase